MGIRFNALSETERAAVAAFVEAEYDKLVFQQPGTYVSQNAQTDPKQWQDALRELIAGDPERLEAIIEAANGSPTQSAGFTLIEMSIVLVIIGLIVGGVLVGQSLVAAAGARATITQIEKYNTAANTFYGKYGYLPGDIPAGPAAQFGFVPRGQYAGEGDGNGFIEGALADSPNSNLGLLQGRGETTLVWVDLSTAHLIEGSFNTASATSDPGNVTGTNIDKYLPQAKLGRGNYVYAYGGSASVASGINNWRNYYGLSAITSIGGGGTPTSNVSLTVYEAYSIDAKTDDGLPQSGRVTAQYANSSIQTNVQVWAAGGGVQGANGGGLPSVPTTTATPGSASTCYDNGSGSGPQQYSVEISNGAGINCALSFRMQAGD
jgi:prepilin-type N-terminal cleavage/methylation domain-containing protein